MLFSCVINTFGDGRRSQSQTSSSDEGAANGKQIDAHENCNRVGASHGEAAIGRRDEVAW